MSTIGWLCGQSVPRRPLETDFEKRWSWGELAALERILAFWSAAPARLRDGRRDLKNQLPDIITFSEKQRGASSSSILSSPSSHKHCDSQRNHTHTLSHTLTDIRDCFWTLTLSQYIWPVCLYLCRHHFSYIWDLFSPPGVAHPALRLPGVSLPRPAAILDYAPLSQLREGALALLRLPSGEGLGWNQREGDRVGHTNRCGFLGR